MTQNKNFQTIHVWYGFLCIFIFPIFLHILMNENEPLYGIIYLIYMDGMGSCRRKDSECVKSKDLPPKLLFV